MENINSLLGIIASLLAIISFFYSRKNHGEIEKIKCILQENHIEIRNNKNKTAILSKVANSEDNGVSVIGNGNVIGRDAK